MLLTISHTHLLLRKLSLLPRTLSSVLRASLQVCLFIFLFCLKVTFKICIKGNESTFFLLHYWIYRYLIVFCNLFFLLAKSSMCCFDKLGTHMNIPDQDVVYLSSWFRRPTLNWENLRCIIWSTVSILFVYCHDIWTAGVKYWVLFCLLWAR